MGRKSTQPYKYILRKEILNYFTKVIEKGNYTGHAFLWVMELPAIFHTGRGLLEVRNK